MTQVIAFLNQDFISVVSDRRFSYLNHDGSFRGIHSDDNCKLINLCGSSIISYCGLGEIDKLPTHEWVARVLSNENCTNGYTAANILKNKCEISIRRIDRRHSHITFLICGWTPRNQYTLPYSIRISNTHGEMNNYLKSASRFMKIRYFNWNSRLPVACLVIGQNLRPEQKDRLNRVISRYLIKKSLPSATLSVLKDEIINSWKYGNGTVGNKVLGSTIPNPNINSSIWSNPIFSINSLPNLITPSFTYFENGFDRIKQYGPVFICGKHYLTDVIGEISDDGNKISVEAKFS